MPENSSSQTNTDVFDKTDVQANKHLAAAAYLWVLCLIPLLTKKDSRYAQFHAKQGLVLFILSLIAWFPFFGWIIGVALIIVSVLAIIKTLDGEAWQIPYIYGLSKKIKI